MSKRRQGGGEGFKPTHQSSHGNPKSKAETILHALNSAPEIDRIKYLRSQSFPSMLYKLKAVDIERPQILEDIIVDSRLYLSSPELFNDPFDMKPRLTVEGDLSSLLTKIRSLPAPSPQAKQDALRRAQSIWQEHGWPGISNEFRIQESAEALFSETGVFCFSTSCKTSEDARASRESGPRNNLMWSHYGDSHRGICLQFQVFRYPLILGRLVRVSYSDSFPEINWISPAFEQEYLYAATNKHSRWSYENEWRHVQLNSAGSYLHFEPSFLSGIILGAKISESSIGEITRILGRRDQMGLPPLKKFRAEMKPGSYQIKFSRWIT
jgi:hypothetical protein